MKHIVLALTVISVLLFSVVAGTLLASAAENSWTTKTPMSTARCNAGVAAIDGMIYVIGGSQMLNESNHYFSVTINSTEAYYPAADTWTEKASMPTSRSSFGAAVYQNKIYCIGGFSISKEGTPASIPTGVNEVYEPSTDKWERKTPMPTARYGFEANAVDGKIYLIGGWYGSDKSAQVDIYDPLTDTWTTGMPMPTAVAEYASAVVDNKIYIISGVASGTTITNLTQIYDPKTDLWSYGAPLPMAVKNAAAAAATGANTSKAIYVAGGNNATYPLNAQYKVQVYFPDHNYWSVAASMPIDRAGLSAAALGDTLFVVGGGHNIFTPDSTVLMQYTPFSLGEPEYSPTIPIVTVAVMVVAVVIALLLVHFKK